MDGKSVGAVSSFAFEKITASHTIEASFAKKDSATVKDPIKRLPIHLPIKMKVKKM